MPPPAALAATIARCYPDLAPRLQRAARFIAEHPDQIAVRSMREIARRAAVAPATMVRLARALDFADYGDLKDVFIRRVETPDAAHATRAQALQASKRSGPVLVEHLATAQIAAVQSSAANPEAAVAAFLRALSAARQVAFLGLRASHAIAFHFAYVYGLLRDNGYLLDDRGGALRDHAARLSAGDALIAISLAPYTRATVEAVEVAETRGAIILALTDSAVSPLARRRAPRAAVSNGRAVVLQHDDRRTGARRNARRPPRGRRRTRGDPATRTHRQCPARSRGLLGCFVDSISDGQPRAEDRKVTRILHRSLRAPPCPRLCLGERHLHHRPRRSRRYIDASGGAAVSCVGHGHPGRSSLRCTL